MKMAERGMKAVGMIVHYYTRINVAIVELDDTLSVGDRILIQGRAYPITTDIEQTIESMQIEHKNITSAGSGQSIGLKVDGRVRAGDKVYKIL